MNEDALNPEESQKIDAETQEMRNLLQRNEAARQETSAATDKKTVTPASVKAAAILAIAHGALLALNAVLASRALGDMRMVPYNVIWFGVTIVLAGALFERQAWAWWGITLFGGMAVIVNLLKVVAFFLYRAGGLIEDAPTFSPPLVGAASGVMLLAVILLALPEAKAAFGMAKKTTGQS